MRQKKQKALRRAARENMPAILLKAKSFYPTEGEWIHLDGKSYFTIDKNASNPKKNWVKAFMKANHKLTIKELR